MVSQAVMAHRLRAAVRGVRRGLWRHVGRFLATAPQRFGREDRRDRPTEYLVLWKIYVEAHSPQEAADEALTAQRNLESRATLFEVRDEWGRWQTIGGRDDAVPGHRLRLVKRS